MAIIMGKGYIEAIYGLMGWKGLMIPMNLHFKYQTRYFCSKMKEKSEFSIPYI